jgi:hypothetical protein
MLSDIIFDPVNPQTMYVADRFSGVYVSTDGGTSWLPLNNNLRTRAVNKLAMSADGQHLYAATEGEGVYRLDLSGQPPAAMAESMEEIATALPAAAEETLAAAPTSEPAESGGGICGGAAVLPVVLLGLTWWRRRKV